MKPPQPVVSVCIVTGGRPELLDECLDCLEAQVDPPSYELLVCSNDDPSVGAQVLRRFPQATVGLVHGAYLGVNRNFLVERSRGDLILFVDDDAVFPNDLLHRLADMAERHPEAGVFGGPNETPPGSSFFQVVQGAVPASIVTSGPVRRRYGPHPPGPADETALIGCIMAFRREAVLPFDDTLFCAEETAVLSELRKHGVGMRYDPGFHVYHERRPTLRSLGQQMVKYGRGRGQLMRKAAHARRLAYLVPAAVLAMVAAAPLLALVNPWLLVPLGAYALMTVAGAIKVAATLRNVRAFPLAAFLVVFVHLGYGAGVLHGLAARRRTRTPAPPHWVDLTAAGRRDEAVVTARKSRT